MRAERERLSVQCLRHGRVDMAALDDHGVEAFAFAQRATTLAAAEAVLAYAERVGGQVERELAEAFVAEAAGQPLAPERYAGLAERLADRGSSGSHGLDEPHLLYRETFRAFAEREVAPLADEIHRQDLLVPERLIRGLAELGCFGLSIPERYGGVQPDDRPDNLGMVVVTEELSRASLGAAGSLITRPEILAKALLKGGTEAQRRAWLPRVARGELMVAIATSEPDYGSDVANLRLQATPTEGGWRLNGAKTWCTFGGRAELLLVLARTDPDVSKAHRGLSLFLVEKPAYRGRAFEHRQEGGGKLEGRAIPTLGYRGMHSFDLYFEDYFVPAENLVGGEAGLGRGFALQMEGFAGGRLQTAGRSLGLMQSAFERALAYTRQRVVFDRPLFAYQLVRYRLGRIAAWIEAGRQLAYHVARRVDEGRDPAGVGAAMAKLFSARAAEWVTREAQQLHGGLGYADGHAPARLFVDARVLSIFEGAEEVLALRVIARALLEGAASEGP